MASCGAAGRLGRGHPRRGVSLRQPGTRPPSAVARGRRGRAAPRRGRHVGRPLPEGEAGAMSGSVGGACPAPAATSRGPGRHAGRPLQGADAGARGNERRADPGGGAAQGGARVMAAPAWRDGRRLTVVGGSAYTAARDGASAPPAIRPSYPREAQFRHAKHSGRDDYRRLMVII